MLHPLLGPLLDVGKAVEWQSGPLRIGVFPIPGPIWFFTGRVPPSAEQLALAERLVRSDAALGARVAGLLMDHCMTSTRDTCLATIGDSRYPQDCTVADLPAIHRADEVWSLFDGLTLIIDERLIHSFSFAVRFDRDHDHVVRFRGDAVHEVLLDG